MSTLTQQLTAFTDSVEELKTLKATIKADIGAWEHTLNGKSELTEKQKKDLRSAISSAKRQLGLVKPAKS